MSASGARILGTQLATQRNVLDAVKSALSKANGKV